MTGLFNGELHAPDSQAAAVRQLTFLDSLIVDECAVGARQIFDLEAVVSPVARQCTRETSARSTMKSARGPRPMVFDAPFGTRKVSEPSASELRRIHMATF